MRVIEIILAYDLVNTYPYRRQIKSGSPKYKDLDFSRGFCINGGSGEIRTRDKRIIGSVGQVTANL